MLCENPLLAPPERPQAFLAGNRKTGNKPPENPPETSLINVNYVAWLCRKMNGTESEGKQSAKA
jgi:hypothetical protein